MIDLPLILRIHSKMARRVRYRLGAKARTSQQTGEIEELDCSGYVRYLMQRCGEPDVPDGTWAQSRWLATSGWEPKLYDNLKHTVNDPTRLFVAGFTEYSDARGRRRHGHIWLVHQGRTLESYGGVGVGSRAWSHATLKSLVTFCYEVPIRDLS